MIRNRLKKIIFISLGTISTGLAVLGIILPLMPATPFLLMAAFFYLKSSQRLYDWLMHHPLLGRMINDYLKHRSISVKNKIIAILSLWISLGTTIFLVHQWIVRILLPLIGIAVTIHLILLKTSPAVQKPALIPNRITEPPAQKNPAEECLKPVEEES